MAAIYLTLALILTSFVFTGNAQAFRDLAPPGFYVGAVFHGNSASWNEPDYRRLALENFSIMTSSVYLTSAWNNPNQPVNTVPFKNVINLLRSKNILVHGHAMLYPALATEMNWWTEQPLNMVQNNMFKYMQAVAVAGKGKVYSWDVVNEVMGDDGDDNDADGVRRSMGNGKPIMEYKAMGQSYIQKAFKFARSQDPGAKLLLTDYGIEEDSVDNDNEKSDRLYRFVKKLLAAGVPIDGIGFQMHVRSVNGNPNYVAIARNFERFRRLGLLVYITEMDVTSYLTKTPNSAPPASLKRAALFQGQVYRRILEICITEPACVAFRFWDFAEYNSRVPNLPGGYSWLHPISSDENQLGVYAFPSPFSDINPNNFRPKLAWNAMRDVMKNFAESEGGVDRITSTWHTQDSYIASDGIQDDQGDWTPAGTVHLFELNNESAEWTSLKWRLERDVGIIKIYRIQCLWEQGYLTRAGAQDKSVNTIPGREVVVADLHMDWTSQQWIIDYNSDDTYKISSNWKDGNDYLTRLGTSLNWIVETGVTNNVGLQSYHNVTSQHWYLQRTL
ncbi:endo-1-4-beta-xylanase [Fragilaria crotonensis]|nr:endo-1-4-beta-xylanase [Fragilaria crotonensis]